jgi:hypothetical protein
MAIMTIEQKITNKKLVTLFEGNYKKITVKKFWNSHGKMIPRDVEVFSGDVKITKLTQTSDICGDQEFWSLYINGERINGDVSGYSFGLNVGTVKVTIGWG